MDRRAFIARTLALLAAPLAAEAQPVGKVYRIGWLHPVPLPPEWLEGFRQGLREFGYVEGKDLVIESRWGGVSIGFRRWRQNWSDSTST